MPLAGKRRQMELYFPRCYDARAVPRAPIKNQELSDKPAGVRVRRVNVPRAGATAWLVSRGPARCLASVALLVAAASCSSLAETQPSGDYAGNGSGVPGAAPRPLEPQNAGSPVPAATPGTGPDESGQDQGPNATETNFLTLPCATDADCGGSPCILPADAGRVPVAFSSDAGTTHPGALDAGVSDAGVTDAGATPTVPWGRCSVVD
jgi:hypothetical protein